MIGYRTIKLFGKCSVKNNKNMKNDIKRLYEKDPKLAVQVAKALGYTLVNVKSSLTNPGLDEAIEFVYRNYSKKNKGTKKIDLFPIIRVVTKKFNSYNTPNSGFSIDKLIKTYIDYRLKNFSKSRLKNTPEARKIYIESYGLDTLPSKYQAGIKEFLK